MTDIDLAYYGGKTLKLRFDSDYPGEGTSLDDWLWLQLDGSSSSLFVYDDESSQDLDFWPAWKRFVFSQTLPSSFESLRILICNATGGDVNIDNVELYVEDAELGTVPVHNITPRLSETPGVWRRPAPELGEHTDAVLQAAGYDAEAIAKLREAGAVG